MRRTRRALVLVSALAVLSLVAEAGAADFSPKTSISLANTRSDSLTALNVKVEQDQGEEELEFVEIRVPAGFTLPTDQALPNNTLMGTGTINIHAGPRCSNPNVPASAPLNITNVEIRERDRSPQEMAAGAIAVYVVVIPNVTTIPLVVKGSPSAGYVLAGRIEPNANTCPPFVFDAKFNERAANGVPILVNPRYGGNYRFEAIFKGLQGSTSRSEHVVAIDGPEKPGGGGGDIAAKKKKCKKLKGKKRKKCLKKLKG